MCYSQRLLIVACVRQGKAKPSQSQARSRPGKGQARRGEPRSARSNTDRTHRRGSGDRPRVRLQVEEGDVEHGRGVSGEAAECKEEAREHAGEGVLLARVWRHAVTVDLDPRQLLDVKRPQLGRDACKEWTGKVRC